MAHKIRIACLGTSDSLSRAVDALLDNQVIPAENIFLSRTDGPQVERFSASGCQLLPDDMNTIVKGELVLVAAPGNEMASVLAPVCCCTSGRYLIAVSDHAQVADLSERVANGTQIMAVQTETDGNGTVCGKAEYGKGFVAYMKPPCEDIVRAMIPNLTVCN